MDLRNASQAIGILYLAAIAVGFHDLAAREHRANVACGTKLAIVRPDLAVTLLDSSAKKLRFVRQAVAELGLGNVEVVQARMQEYQPARAFDMVISRAVSNLDDLYRQSHHLLAAGGRMLFMKGSLPEAEMSAFPPGRETLHAERLRVPGLNAERHLLWLDKRG